MATFINLKRKEQIRLNKFKFFIAHNACDSLFFRVNLYNKNREEIGENITPQNILVSTAIKSGVVTVDLDPYDIWLDEDFYISLEWIKDFCPPQVQDELNFSSKLWKTFYYKSTSQDKWEKLRGVGIGMWLEVSSNKS